MGEVKEKYSDRDVEFLAMYVREPHPQERGFRRYTVHRNYEHKLSYAKELEEIKGTSIPVIVDGMDEGYHELLGNLPNFVYVVGKDGLVKFKATWLDAGDVDEILAELVTADNPALPVRKTISTERLGSGI